MSVPMPDTPKSHKSADTDTTATNSSDEFDWDEGEAEEKAKFEASKAKRLRLVYLAFMKLSRTIRTLLVGILGSAILITPLLVVELRFKSHNVHSHVFTWSLWFSIVWATACVTYLIVDTIPRLVIGIIVLLGGKVERFKFQLEVMSIYVSYSHSDSAIASPRRVWLAQTRARHILGVDSSFYHTRSLQACGVVLADNQSSHASSVCCGHHPPC